MIENVKETGNLIKLNIDEVMTPDGSAGLSLSDNKEISEISHHENSFSQINQNQTSEIKNEENLEEGNENQFESHIDLIKVNGKSTKKKTNRRSRLIISDEENSTQHPKKIYSEEEKMQKALESAVYFNICLSNNRNDLDIHFLKRKIEHSYEREDKSQIFFNVPFYPKEEMFGSKQYINNIPPPQQQQQYNNSNMNRLNQYNQKPGINNVLNKIVNYQGKNERFINTNSSNNNNINCNNTNNVNSINNSNTNVSNSNNENSKNNNNNFNNHVQITKPNPINNTPKSIRAILDSSLIKGNITKNENNRTTKPKTSVLFALKSDEDVKIINHNNTTNNNNSNENKINSNSNSSNIIVINNVSNTNKSTNDNNNKNVSEKKNINLNNNLNHPKSNSYNSIQNQFIVCNNAKKRSDNITEKKLFVEEKKENDKDNQQIKKNTFSLSVEKENNKIEFQQKKIDLSPGARKDHIKTEKNEQESTIQEKKV